MGIIYLVISPLGLSLFNIVLGAGGNTLLGGIIFLCLAYFVFKPKKAVEAVAKAADVVKKT